MPMICASNNTLLSALTFSSGLQIFGSVFTIDWAAAGFMYPSFVWER